MRTSSGTKAASQALYSQPEITARGSFSKSHLYAMVARGHFPCPALRCGPRFTRWAASDVEAWFADPAGWIAAHAKQVEGAR